MAVFVLLGTLCGGSKSCVWVSLFYSSGCFCVVGSWGPAVLFGFPSHPSPPFAHVSEEGGLGWIGVGDWRKVPLLERFGGQGVFCFFGLGFVFVYFVLFVVLFFCFVFCSFV